MAKLVKASQRKNYFAPLTTRGFLKPRGSKAGVNKKTGVQKYTKYDYHLPRGEWAPAPRRLPRFSGTPAQKAQQLKRAKADVRNQLGIPGLNSLEAWRQAYRQSRNNPAERAALVEVKKTYSSILHPNSLSTVRNYIIQNTGVPKVSNSVVHAILAIGPGAVVSFISWVKAFLTQYGADMPDTITPNMGYLWLLSILEPEHQNILAQMKPRAALKAVRSQPQMVKLEPAMKLEPQGLLF